VYKFVNKIQLAKDRGK